MAYYRFYRFNLLILLSFIVVACATTQVRNTPDPEHINTAKRFLRSCRAYELAMNSLERKMESESKEWPEGYGELIRRVFADITAEEFEDFAAPIYARHLPEEHLAELERFTKSRTGKRFFRLIIARRMENKSAMANDDIMRQFNADELTEIMKFILSDALAAMKQAHPAINREMADAARQFGEAKLREYLKRH